MAAIPQRSEFASNWVLDPEFVFLNHGSFGACPKKVLEKQSQIRARMEGQPVRFFVRELEEGLDAARKSLGAFVGADPENLAFVPNATTGVNAVLRSFPFEAGDELLTTDHAYHACRNALDYVAQRSGATVKVVKLFFPLSPDADPETWVDQILGEAGAQSKMVLVDHITSPTGAVLPLSRLIRELRQKGVRCLVDGAHAPGMIDLDLRSLDPDYYTGNCHKWMCTPKGAALLYVRPELQSEVRPTTVSHGYDTYRPDRSHFALEFDWMGTDDPSAVLCIPEAIEVMGEMLSGAWDELRRRNRELVMQGQRILSEVLGEDLRALPEAMMGTLAACPLPGTDGRVPEFHGVVDELQNRLFFEHKIEIPVFPWPAINRKIVRLSAQLYNSPEQYEYLAKALKIELARLG